jgi:hypothetical protein
MATIEEMEKKLVIAKEILATEKQLSELTMQQQQAIKAAGNILETNAETVRVAVDLEEKKIIALEKQLKNKEIGQNYYDREIKNHQREIEHQKAMLKLANSRLATSIKQSEVHDRIKKINEQSKKESDARIRQLKTESGELAKITKGTKERATAQQLVVDSAKQIAAIGSDFMSLGGDLINAALPEVVLAKFLGFQLSLQDIGKDIQALPVQFDKAFSGIVKATGMPLESIKNNLQAAMDPEGARAGIEGFQESLDGLNLSVDDQPFVDIGITVEDSKEALSALIQESSLFRADFLKNEPAAASVTANLVAGLKKVGVQTKTSAKLIDVFTKAFGKAPVEAGKSLRSVAGIATSLGMDINKVFGNFESAMPTLSQFGSEMTEVFADLQARSAATGAEMGKLVSIAMKMDTFEGAAKAAQTLNGVLGDTLISVTDLAHADPDEKFDMIAEAVNNSGVEFESLNRRYKSIIASAAGFDNVAEFQRQLLGEEAVDEAKAAVDTGPLTTENLAERAKQGMDMQEKSKASVSSFGVAAVKAYEAASGAAESYNNVIKNSLIKTARTLKGDLGKTFVAAREGIAALGGAEDEVERAATLATDRARGGAKAFIGVKRGKNDA